MYQWPQYHIVSELRAEGHIVTNINTMEILGRKGTKTEYSEILLQKVKQIMENDKVDMFFTAAGDDFLDGAVVREIRRMGLPTVLMCCDDISVPFLHKHIASSFDLVWGTSRENQNLLRSYGARTIMMPYAANPYIYKPVEVEENIALGFIGRIYGTRSIHLSAIAFADLPVQIFGKDPKAVYEKDKKKSIPLTRAMKSFRSVVPYIYQSLLFPVGRRCVLGALKRSFLEHVDHPSINNNLPESVSFFPGPPFEDIGATYSQLALSLGSMELHSTYVLKKPIMCIHLREFEAPMCGAVHLTNRWPELQEYYEEGKEMLFYGSKEELLDKVRYYLHPSRDTLRQKIRRGARRRAENDHTWLRRFDLIWKTVGISAF